MLSDVVDCMDLAGVGKNARRRIVDDGVVFPAVPEPRDDIQIFPGALVTLAMWRMLGQAEILCRLRRGRGDDVPAGSAATDVVERSEQPRQIVGLGGRGGRGGSRPRS